MSLWPAASGTLTEIYTAFSEVCTKVNIYTAFFEAYRDDSKDTKLTSTPSLGEEKRVSHSLMVWSLELETK